VALGDAYTQLIAFLGQHGVQYRLIDHAPEGRTEIVSPMRGNVLSQATPLCSRMTLLQCGALGSLDGLENERLRGAGQAAPRMDR